jgi:hexosaminidase
MRKVVFVILGLVVAVAGYAADVIPKPVQMKSLDGEFVLHDKAVIGYSEQARDEALKLRDYLEPATGYHFNLKAVERALPEGIQLLLVEDGSRFGEEGYAIKVTPKVVKIEAATTAGLFYGIQTLRQLLPVEIFSPKVVSGKEWKIGCVDIFDKPRFAWRGMMLDVSRRFLKPDYVKKYLDNMAFHKINLFHWHLTDDQGWRIEIKKYPKLTEVGAWRGEGTDLPKLVHDASNAKCGGFYTQAEIKDIVAYAKRLHIDVMPEVDLPGHALAITHSYPETLPARFDHPKSVLDIKANVISPGKEKNYEMIDDIMGELAEMFPFEYVHVGGDEVNSKLWRDSSDIKDLMKREGLRNLGQVRGYFTRRLEKIVGKHGKKMVGWNEIMGGGVSTNTVIMSWVSEGPGLKAAKRGHNVVMCPGRHVYFDMKYPGPGERGHWWAGIIDTKKTYSYDPLRPGVLDAEQSKRIKGTQACLWTSFVPDNADADYKTYPRLCALCEVAWTPQSERSWDDFSKRLGTHLRRLGLLGVNYHLAISTAFYKLGKVTIEPPFKDAEVRYTVNGSNPDSKSSIWQGKPFSANPRKVRLCTFFDGKKSKVTGGAKRLHFANWNKNNAGTEYKEFEFNASREIVRNGLWKLDFVSLGGKNKLKVRNVRLLVDGKPVSSDTHEAVIINGHRESSYKLDVPVYKPGAKYVILAEMMGEGGNSTGGVLILDLAEVLGAGSK